MYTHTHSGSKRELSLSAIEEDRAREEGIGREAAREGVEQGGLAGPRRPHQGGEGAGLGVARQPLEHLLGPATPRRHSHRQILPRQPGGNIVPGNALRVQPVPPQSLAKRAQPRRSQRPRRLHFRHPHLLLRRRAPRHLRQNAPKQEMKTQNVRRWMADIMQKELSFLPLSSVY